MDKLTQQIKQRIESASDYLQTKRTQWDEYENLFLNKLDTRLTENTKSKVFDPKLATLAIERSARVMSQFPTGKVRGVSRNDEGAAKLMNLVLDRYVMPNAKAQFDLLTKFRMVDLYSNIYGNFFTFIDMDVKKNGYVGPDLWLLNIRDVFPQVGAVSLEDSDFVIVRTWQPKSYFENKANQKGYKNISKLIDALKDKNGKKENRDDDSETQRESEMYPDAKAARGAGFYEVYSMYERDRWVDYCADADMTFRDIDNPHDNGELPVVCKYSLPLLDDFMGMGDFERGKSMQKTLNSLWNLYLDAVKISIFPPVLINKDNIASKNSIKWAAAARWMGRNNINNFAQTMNLTPQGINTFNNTYQVVTAALMNQFGSTDTSISTNTDQSFGKTPQALKMQSQREASRDNADRFYVEQYLKNVFNRFTNLVAKKLPKDITVRLFGNELEELVQAYPDVAEMYDEEKGEITLGKDTFGSAVFDYEMVSGSTFSADQEAQQGNLLSILELFMKNPQLIQVLKEKEGIDIKLGEIIKKVMINSNVSDWSKILVDNSQGVNGEVEAMMKEQLLQFQQMVGTPTNVNEVPAQPIQNGNPTQSPTGY